MGMGRAERMPSVMFVVTADVDPDALRWLKHRTEECEGPSCHVRGHKDSLARQEQEGDGEDTYRRTQPNMLSPDHDLTSIFRSERWRRH